MMQRVKLISDGTAVGTKVIDAAGNRIEGIKSLCLTIDAGAGSTKLTLTMLDVEVDVTATTEKGVNN